MKKKFALEEIEKAKYFFLDFMINECIPLTIKITKKQFKNLVLRFDSNENIDIYTMITTNDNQTAIFFVITINNK